MAWVLRRPSGMKSHLYWTGAGFSEDPRSAVRFGRRAWAEAIQKKLFYPSWKVVRRRCRLIHRCRPRCPCLVSVPE